MIQWRIDNERNVDSQRSPSTYRSMREIKCQSIGLNGEEVILAGED